MAKLARGIKNKDHISAVNSRRRVETIIDAIPPEDLVLAIKRAPSLRGMILGYIAEEMFTRHVLNTDQFSDVRKHDDHDRSNNKADRDFVYCGKRVSVQLKSIQTNSICWREDLNCLYANVQNDGSDKRDVILPNNERISTTNYKVGDYDILAVPLFPFTGDWTFGYLLNRDCRKTVSNKYTKSQQTYLLSTMEEIVFPLQRPWHSTIEGAISALQM
jgi:hypothetical protein